VISLVWICFSKSQPKGMASTNEIPAGTRYIGSDRAQVS
jgi:hypothetical protein